MAFWSKILKRTSGQTPQSERKDIVSSVAAGSGSQPAAEKQARTITTIGVLRSPHVTEKSGRGTELRTYTFVVAPDATAFAVRRAVEQRYGVHVDRVRTLILPGKKRIRGKITGWKPGIKKAMATLREGEKIEIQ